MGSGPDRDRGWHLRVGQLASLLVVAGLILITSNRAGVAADPFVAMQVVIAERGKEAPDLALPDPEGKRMGLRDFRGKVVLLTFFTTW